MKAAIYCRSCPHIPDMRRQQEQLEEYVTKHDWELTAAYFDDCHGSLNLQNAVQLSMLQAAKQKDFDILLITSRSAFPNAQDSEVPPMRILILDERKTISIGKSTNPVFDAHKKKHSRVSVHLGR